MDLPLSSGLFGGIEADKILHVFPRAVLGCAIIRIGESLPLAGPEGNRAENTGPPLPPRIPFRAGAAANMLYRREDPAPPGEGPSAGFSFAWKLGKPVWLPRQPRLPRQPAAGKERRDP
jgi:hypothetical protein